VKCAAAEEAWKKASVRQGLWKQHKKALESQLKNMMSGFRRPTLHPIPQPFLYCDYKSDNEQSSKVHIGLCPFCLRKFEPIWNCNLVPCLHCYHSWCLLTHFSESTMCIAEGCKLEPCDEWWVAVGLTKPVLRVGTSPNSKWGICPSSGDSLAHNDFYLFECL
jgi:hypothetical protein